MTGGTRGGVGAIMARLGRLWGLSIGLAAVSVMPAAAMSSQQRIARDTVTPHYARWNDELPEMLATVSSVMQSGMDAATRAAIVSELRAIAPKVRPGSRERPPWRTFSLTAGFRDRTVPVSLYMYWSDTGMVGFRVRSPDVLFVDAVDSALHAARVAPLVKPEKVRLTVGDAEGYDGGPSSISMSISVDPAKHCPWFGLDHDIERRADTIAIHVYGVAPPGHCPTPIMRGSGYSLALDPGRYVFVLDSRGDTNVVTMDVADTAVALTPRRATFVDADRAVKWRLPSASFLLICHRAAGDPRLCDALHEWVSQRPGMRQARFARSGISPLGYHFGEERVAVYRYPDETIASTVRRCIASIPPQVRLNSWVQLRNRSTDGTWKIASPSGSSSSEQTTIADVLDASGSIPRECGAPVALAGGRAPVATANPASLRPPHVTGVSMFADGGVDPTTIEARSDGWIVMTPLMSVWAPEPYPTTHLYASAADALRWVERVRAVVGVRRDTSATGVADMFIPPLGRGPVHVETRVAADSARGLTVSFSFVDCTGLSRGYNVDRTALLEIAGDVERAAQIALRASPVATTPALGRPFYSDEASCRVVKHSDSAKPRYPDDASEDDRRVTEVGVRFIVDTAGRVEDSSVTLLPDVPPRIAAAARAVVAGWRYRAADWGGVPVRQYVVGTLAFDPSAPATATPQIAPLPMRQGGIFGVRRYPLRITAPASDVPSRVEVAASVVVDTNGVADAKTLVVMPGTDARVLAALRNGVGAHHFRPALHEGRKVAARKIGVWLVEPPADCLADDAGPECPPDDRVLAGAPTPSVPPALLRPSAFYDVRAEVAPVNESELLPAALGVPSLKSTALPAGVREIRIYSGLVIAYPHSALIVRQEGGTNGRVSGRLVQYWPVNDTMFTKTMDVEALYTTSTAGRCDEPHRGVSVVACTVRFVREPDWRALLRVLDSVNAWTLPDESKVPSRGMTIDGWRLRVEARLAASYRQYEFHNPEVYRPPEGPNALRLMAIVDSLYRYTRPPRDLQFVRGIYLYGPDTSDFVRCGRPEKPGLFRGQLGPIKAFLGDSAWRARRAPSRALEVEAWVRRRTVGEEQHGPRYYPRIWQVDSVMAVRAGPARRCGE
jgi:hypothetical protein